MNKEKILEALSRRFVNYQNLISIPIEDNGDSMVSVADYNLKIGHEYSVLAPSTGENLILRREVCERLVQARKILKDLKPDYDLVMVYAYRSMEIQKTNFEKMKRELSFGDRADPEAMERTHHFIAVPEMAGHPTGGAIDLLIIDENNKPLDFGTSMHALEVDSYNYCPFISDTATINRKLLRRVMQEAGFAPYDGEWWHFSYGDREWAAYYNEPITFYKQLELDPEWLK
jgi:D-alanyl-D-alanine dipeptidase